MNWSVGVITCPRKHGYYLDQTLKSLQQAGWSNITVFAEPESKIPDFDGTVVTRRKVYGDWTNWATGLYDLFLSEPETDYFFMLEDDAVVCRGAKRYLEFSLPYLEEFGALSLFTPSCYHGSFLGFHNECHDQSTRSTVTIVMSQKSVLSFFSDIDVQRHRFTDLYEPGIPLGSYGAARTSLADRVGNTVKDAVIGCWAAKNKLPIFFHTPSLAEHIGEFSTLTSDVSSVENGRVSVDFVGQECSLEDMIDKPRITRHSEHFVL